MQEPQVNFIRDIDEFRALVGYFNAAKPEYMFLDVETDSPQEQKAKLYGIGICFDESEAFYIPFRTNKGMELWHNAQLEFISESIEHMAKQTKLVNHNIVFDCLVLERNLGIDLSPYIYSDTILQYHTLYEDGVNHTKSFKLKDICKFEFGEHCIKAQERLHDNIIANGGKVLEKQVDMYLADTDVLGEYCCWDVIITCMLFNKLEPLLKQQNLMDLFYKDEIMPLYKEVTIDMKRNGFPVDVPYFAQLKLEVENEINRLENEILEEAKDHIEEHIQKVLDKKYPVSRKGKFPKILASVCDIPLPVTKDGKVTMAAKAIEKQAEATPEFNEFYDWVSGKDDPNLIWDATDGDVVKTDKGVILQKGGRKKKAEIILYDYITDRNLRAAQEKWFLEDSPGEKSVFNLRSNDHLGALIFGSMGYAPLEKTKTGKPKLDEDFLEAFKDKIPFVPKLIDYKKLNKLLSTYIDGILNRQINGVIYTSMLQFGTTSGRYSSRDPNLQNLPRIKEDDAGLSELVLKYTNAIKRGFIAKKGSKLIGADYSSLEPICFAEMSNEQKIKEVFIKGEDLYSRVAIDVNVAQGVFKPDQFSAHKKAPNYLKTLMPEVRQLWKVPTLGIVYGMEESRLREAIGCSYKEATNIINGYLGAYPNLKKYMRQCDYEAKTQGYVKTMFGRIRHLNEVKSIATIYGDKVLDYKWANANNLADKRRIYKNLLNNAKNFKIQGLAAHIVNRSALALTRAFKAAKIDGMILNQVHDELICMVREDQTEEAAKIMKYTMENTVKISIPLTADPVIADTWDQAK